MTHRRYKAVRRGFCRWCSHPKAVHFGASKAMREAMPNVKWTTTACSFADCRGCRRYEV